MENEESVEERLAERLGWKEQPMLAWTFKTEFPSAYAVCLSLLTESEEKDKEISNLKTGECPQCDNTGSWGNQIGEEEYEQVKCEWCWRFPGSLFALNETKGYIASLNSTITTLTKELLEANGEYTHLRLQYDTDTAKLRERIGEMEKEMEEIRGAISQSLSAQVIEYINQAHWTNIEVRLNGKYVSIEADWVKDIIRTLFPKKESAT